MTPTLHQLSLILLAIGAASMLACADDEPPFPLRYETEHLRVGLPEGEEVCTGDLAAFERQLTNVEDLLDAPIPGKVDVYLWRFSEYPKDDYCGGDNSGCYVSDPPTIYSSLLSLNHELVHAVAFPLGDPPAMWSEGIAEALHTERTLGSTTAPTVNFHRPVKDLDYRSAGHFTRWAWDTYGPETVRALLSDPREPELAFKALTGQTLAEAEADYFATAPYSYGLLKTCEEPELTKLDATTWRETITLDCGDEWTRMGIDRLGGSRVFEVETRADFSFASDADSLIILPCADEDIQVKPEDGDPAWGDVPPMNSVWPDGFVRAVNKDGEQDLLDLVPGRYQLAFAREGPGPVILEVTQVSAVPSP